MMAMADRDGFVAAAVPGIAKVAGHPLEQVERDLERLMSPDPYSKNPRKEGRRVTKVRGGFLLTTYEEHREMASVEDQREKAAARQRRKRQREREREAAEKPEKPEKPAPAELFPDHPTPSEQLAREWMEHSDRYRKHPEEMTAKELQKWAKALDDCTRLDKVAPEMVAQVVRFVYADRCERRPGNTWEGWSKVIQTAMKLRRIQKSSGQKYIFVMRDKIEAGEKPNRLTNVKTNPEDYDDDDEIPI
jgi:hypothetical protein